MNKAKCSRAGRNLAKRPSSQAGRALAECRWGKKKPTKKPAKKPVKKPAKTPAAPLHMYAGATGLLAESRLVRQSHQRNRERKEHKKHPNGRRPLRRLRTFWCWV